MLCLLGSSCSFPAVCAPLSSPLPPPPPPLSAQSRGICVMSGPAEPSAVNPSHCRPVALCRAARAPSPRCALSAVRRLCVLSPPFLPCAVCVVGVNNYQCVRGAALLPAVFPLRRAAPHTLVPLLLRPPLLCFFSPCVLHVCYHQHHTARRAGDAIVSVGTRQLCTFPRTALRQVAFVLSRSLPSFLLPNTQKRRGAGKFSSPGSASSPAAVGHAPPPAPPAGPAFIGPFGGPPIEQKAIAPTKNLDPVVLHKVRVCVCVAVYICVCMCVLLCLVCFVV